MDKRILIVEDEFIVADDLQLTLEGAGYTVYGIAASVTEAKDLMKKRKPDLVLLDIHLKGKLSGIDLAKELQAERTAFVYLSANSNQAILEAAKATEPYGFLVKPFREKDLLITLEVAFYRHTHSLEARWYREVQLQKSLAGVQQTTGSWEQKMIHTAKALQAFISFDCLAGKLKHHNNEHFSGFAFLRIGFDEYQVLGLHELSVVSGEKAGIIQAIIDKLPPDTTAGFYNGPDFQNLFTEHSMKALLAKTFGFASNLVLPLLTADGYTFSLSFYRRIANGYGSEQLDWLSHLQQPLTAILESISREEKEGAVSMNYTFEKETSKKGTPGIIRFEGVIGSSAALLNVMDLVAQVAPLDTSVMLLGESGTGKERIADCIHQLSPRSNKPFIKINCAALPPTLIESELFGHEKGAFTGATDRRTGKFELADGGTIFLDEIGDMPLELQVKLLRVLQEKEIERIGGRQMIKVNVRVIAATNRNLETEMAEGRFRLDLYYRLNVFPITLPALRERIEDIEELAEHFAIQFSRKFNKFYKGISPVMLAELAAYYWPGNIRELENIIEQSVILNNENAPLTLKRPLPAMVATSIKATPQNPVLQEPVKTINDIKRLQRQTEVDYISSVLTKTRGRIRGKDGAAELLNEKPTTLESRMAKLGIRKEDFHQ